MKQAQVLLVGDWPEAAQPVERILPDDKVSITKCPGSMEAIKLLQEGSFDVLISQNDIRDLNAYQLCSFLKSSDKTSALPIIILEKEKAANNGALNLAVFPDATLSTTDLINAPEQLLNLVERQSKIGQEHGWKGEPVKLLLASNIIADEHPYQYLLDDLISERLVGNLARGLATNLQTHDRLLQTYFSSIEKIIDADLFGLIVASPQEPWAAFAGKPGLKGKDLEALVQKLKDKLSLTDKLTVEVAIETAGDLGKGLGEEEILDVIADNSGKCLIIFANYEGKKFSRSDLRMMEHLKHHLVEVMLLLLQKSQIEVMRTREAYQAATDPLTGLYNLDFFVGFLQQQLLFSFRQSLGVSVVIMDVDNFADINARLGQDIGNVMLTKLAGRLLGVTRASDLLARYGGDEFAVVLPNTDVQGARVLAEKIRLEIEQMTFIESGEGLHQHITLSIGCAQFDMTDLNPETILRDAKHALQKAKERGKNCVVV